MNDMDRGKEKCEILKAIRTYVAEKYGLEYATTECSHKGDCPGTCPMCDAELADLQQQLEEQGITDISQDKALSNMVENYFNTIRQDEDEQLPLGGEPALPDGIFRTEGMPEPNMPMEGDVTMLPIDPEHKYERKVILECPVAGIGFHDINDIWDELYVGAKLALVREPKNKYDRNAVAVALADDYDENAPEDFDFDFILGYIPRNNNAAIAAMLDMGWQEMLEAEITELKDHAPYSDKLHIAVYIRSKEPVLLKDDRLHIIDFDDEDWEAFKEELWQKGYTYRRWGKLLPDVTDLPEEGDMVVFIHSEDDKKLLYLMKVIAEGDLQVRSILTHDEDLHELIDDCCPYVLTALKGPMKLPSDELVFLGTPWEGHCRPDFKLNKEVSDKLLMLLQEK